jgi:signal transduction histidine kinase
MIAADKSDSQAEVIARQNEKLEAARVSRRLVEVQEALANVAKYARAEHATVTLDISPQASSLTIADDGCGFDPSACQQPATDHGWGLMIMRERAAAVGAELSVESAPGRGTRIVATLRNHVP